MEPVPVGESLFVSGLYVLLTADLGDFTGAPEEDTAGVAGAVYLRRVGIASGTGGRFPLRSGETPARAPGVAQI